MKTVTVQIDDKDFERLQRDAKGDLSFGRPMVGIMTVLVDGEFKPVTKEIK